MKTLYLQCNMGAAGDMLTAALLELMPDPDAVVEELNGLGIPGVEFVKEPMSKCGIGGTHMSVLVHGEEESEEMFHHHHEHEHEGHEHSHEGHEHSHEEYEHSHEGHEHSHEGHGHSCEEHKHHHDHAHMHEDHAHDHDHTHEHTHDHAHHHHHSSLHDIEHIVCDHLNLSEQVKQDVMAVYGLIAEAESHAHGVPVTEIHFHEVGTMDAIADITAVCLLMNRIAPDQVIVSPVHVGSGQVRCAHGILPVPAPATAYILNGVPIYGGAVKGELCTPTGAALLKHFATRFGDMPVMRTEAIGYGMGKKDFEVANCVRAILGETEDAGDTIAQLECNVDDMTAEELGFAMETILAAGALEVYTVPVGMKKSRPGTLLSVLCHEDQKEKLVQVIFRNTTTIGVREHSCSRYTLQRSFETVRTPYGDVQKKVSSGYGVKREKYEYEDLARIAREQGMSLAEVKKQIL
ncbi:nickel pincer cofactor biosynthesis protein LarC [Clostridium sp. OM02-18AC]|uniref:nickel pincer cofactor biosynthesis protein LarC n=1 Tax=Clostridium sp. OM02-18AC TaxID=2292311 RepID=UPI000E49766C|nr:nickel pincer cofactor biosynthesis protein LarC [Clostridium sp. OM02-18AC]RHV65158.1 nickel pincer cofactor biosynthesis protein LarC [Clostridium sp. OM02-18AC]